MFFLIAVSVFDPCLANNDNNLTVGIWSAWSPNKLRFSHKNQYRWRVIIKILSISLYGHLSFPASGSH